MGKSSAGSVKTRLTNVVVSAVAACCVILTVCHFLVNHAHARRLRRFSASSSLLKFYSLVNHQGNFEEQAPQVPKLDILSVYGEGLPVQEAEFDSADWPELFPVNPTFQPVQSADAKHRRGSAPNVAAQEMLLSGEGALGRIAGYRQPRSVSASPPEGSLPASDRPSVDKQDAVPRMPQETPMDTLLDPTKADKMLDKFLYHLKDVAAIQAQQIRSNLGDLSQNADHVQLATGLQETELFGLVWADLKAEQDAADISQVPGGEPADAKRKAKTPDAADMEAIKLSQDVDKDSSVPEGELQAPPESQTLKAVRATMYQNLKSNSEKELRDKLKSDIKEAWRSGRWKGLNRILFASLRLLLEYASLGVKNVLEMFGSAWLWVLDHALRKSVRQLRMFKLFGKVSGYGERLFYFMQWWMMTARYYIEYTEAIRDLVAFIIENSSKISMLVQGGLSLVGGTGGPIFFCVFLWKLSKPAWKLYLTDAALKTSSIHERAATEFMMSQKDYHNFLLGTRALVGDADNGPALELHLPQHQTTELIFLMAYLERYKLPQAAHRVGLLEGSNPMQQYLAYERVTRLKELVSRVPQEARGQLVNLFSELSRWDMTRTSDSLHGLIINNLQRCAILSRVLTNQYLLQRRILAYIASYQRSRIKPCQLAWLANTVIRCAYEVIDRELLFTLDGDHNYALDRTTVRVNNLPSFLYGDTRGLKELLQKFFTFFPMSVLKHPIRQGTPGRALLADMHLDISSGVIGILRNISPRYGERHTTRAVKRTHCPMQVPTIEINTAMRYVKLRFLTSTTTPAPPATPDPDDNQPSETERSSDTGSEQAATDPLCAEVAARSILRQQVTKAVKGEVRRTIFGIPDTVCAPINSPGFVALSRLIDEFVNGGVTDDQLPEALKTGLDILVNEHPSLVAAFASIHPFKHIVLQYVNEVLPLSLSNVAVTKESTSQFLTILGIVQTALRYEPWRLVEYIKDRVLSVHLREQMNDTAELQATALTTHSTGGEAVDGSITATAEASEKKQARDVILDLVAQRFSENLAQIIYGAAESVQLSRKPGKFMYGKTFDQMKDIVTRAFLRCLKSVDNAIGSLERIQGKISTNPSGSLSGPATSQLIEFDSDREGYFESQRGAASNAQDRTEEELKKFLLRRLETEEAEATDQRMIIHTDQTTERKLGEPFFFTKAEIISFLKEGRKAVSDVLEANTEKIVRALRWGYWKEDHFDCLDLSTERTKQLTVDLTAAFKTLLVAKTAVRGDTDDGMGGEAGPASVVVLVFAFLCVAQPASHKILDSLAREAGPGSEAGELQRTANRQRLHISPPCSASERSGWDIRGH
ncbi:conserved hypothetical protein [Neospora caninum Liverpool]|uniref:Transmembrane protein n=1 Tax=Neospora caninum (strain Liverpool) TaxID=572307 RepID=F0VQM9_NEOCL|nr:conserved hypothetical protein [Neospora caninum Liverpool]CBZ56026.1 conserved hypothetical protein [Neospora caninum Liverpool]|eukprot:XP_003886052.1 conserved hypothetical protein [Neospora caninum Liverpool]